MISIINANKFCNEDIRLIENYENAINDVTQTWECHHRKETDEGLSAKKLIELGLYYGRPASEFIFLTKAEHMKLHNKGKSKPKSEKHRIKQSKSIKCKYYHKYPSWSFFNFLNV